MNFFDQFMALVLAAIWVTLFVLCVMVVYEDEKKYERDHGHKQTFPDKAHKFAHMITVGAYSLGVPTVGSFVVLCVYKMARFALVGKWTG